MMNEEQQGVRIVGARTLEDYANGLQRLLPNETLKPKELSGLNQLLQEEKLLFLSKLKNFIRLIKVK